MLETPFVIIICACLLGDKVPAMLMIRGYMTYAMRIRGIVSIGAVKASFAHGGYNRARRQSGFPTFISCQRQDANVLPKRRDKLCDVSTVPLVARWPVFLARGSDADGEPHYMACTLGALKGTSTPVLVRTNQGTFLPYSCLIGCPRAHLLRLTCLCMGVHAVTGPHDSGVTLS